MVGKKQDTPQSNFDYNNLFGGIGQLLKGGGEGAASVLGALGQTKFLEAFSQSINQPVVTQGAVQQQANILSQLSSQNLSQQLLNAQNLVEQQRQIANAKELEKQLQQKQIELQASLQKQISQQSGEEVKITAKIKENIVPLAVVGSAVMLILANRR